MATVTAGGSVSLSGPLLPASISQSHLLAAGGLGENPFETASSSTDSGLASLLLQALLRAPRSASAVATERILVANGIPTIPKNLLLYVLGVGSMSTLRTSCQQSTRLTSCQLSAARSPDSPCYRGTRWCAVAGETFLQSRTGCRPSSSTRRQ